MRRWRHLALGVSLLAGIILVGTIGYVLLGFGELDAMYQTVTTITTVGFREVEPLEGAGKVFTMLLILAGVGTALAFLIRCRLFPGAPVESLSEGATESAFVVALRRRDATFDAGTANRLLIDNGALSLSVKEIAR